MYGVRKSEIRVGLTQEIQRNHNLFSFEEAGMAFKSLESFKLARRMSQTFYLWSAAMELWQMQFTTYEIQMKNPANCCVRQKEMQ